MNLNTYQAQAMQTKQPNAAGLMYDAVALAGEAGEVCNDVKKWHRDDDETLTVARRGKLLSELGDVLWYVANMAHDLGYTLEEIAEANIEKLKARYAAKQAAKQIREAGSDGYKITGLEAARRLLPQGTAGLADAIEAGYSPCREHDRIGDH